MTLELTDPVIVVLTNVETPMRDGVLLRMDIHTQIEKSTLKYLLTTGHVRASTLRHPTQPIHLDTYNLQRDGPLYLSSLEEDANSQRQWGHALVPKLYTCLPYATVTEPESPPSSPPAPKPIALRSSVVLVRTPYDKGGKNARSIALYWAASGRVVAVQDCRGRFQSGGVFYKYTNEANDGYDGGTN